MMDHRNLLSCLICLTAIVALAPTASAQCDLPLMVQQSNTAPNVLVILDSSGSMREVIYHEDYDPFVTWSGSFDTDTAYSINTDGTFSPASFDSSFTDAGTVQLVRSTNGTSGRVMGNYLNWIFYHATDQQRAEQPQATRMGVGKAAVQTLLAEGAGLRFGLMRFNGGTGGTLVSPMGTDPATITTQVTSIVPDSWTPSAETMVDAIEYYQLADASAPIQFECQENFIIFITDGYPTQDLDMPAWLGDEDGDGNEPGTCASIMAPDPNSSNCSDWLDDVAHYGAHHDLRADLDGDQIVRTFTIGFGTDVTLLVDAAANGLGTYQYAWNLQSLSASLGTVVGDIVAQISAGSAVSVVSSEFQSENLLYRAKFLPGPWQGYLEAYDLPYSQGNNPTWEAGNLLANRTAGSRVIFTSQNNTEVTFDANNASLLYADMGAADETEAADVINYVRGEDVAGFRDRGGWKLGDLVHSSPLVVGPPAEWHLDPDYQVYLMNNANRTPVVYVGANDGMLHAFRASSGEELWAYVPHGVLDTLSELTDPSYCHAVYVDLSPVAYELQIGSSWRTVVIGGLRTGGDSYFAIDVSDPFSPDLLWETSVPQVRSSFTTPAVVWSTAGTFLWTGSGPDAGGNASVAVLDASTGAVVFTGDVGTPDTETNLMTAAVAYDADWDGYTDAVYQADLSGNLWRWDVTNANPLSWTGEILFSGDQPIQARPTLVLGPDGNLLVMFGTGRYVENADLNDTQQQSFYCVKDNGTTTNLSRGDLADQTGSIHDVGVYDGWFIDLTQATGERVADAATVVEGVVYFSSFAPDNEECSGGGHSWLYHVDFRNGADPDDYDAVSDRISDIGNGIASRPVVDMANEDVVVQTSDAELNQVDMIAKPKNILVNSWREKFADVSGGQ